MSSEVKITGHIYLITNSLTNKKYVGQTRSHRKNRGKYKPFGYQGRFKDHISEAICNTKKKQCRYLNNSIREHGKESFSVELIHECEINELDKYEIYYIEKYNTLFPNGYNLTKGGRTIVSIDDETINKLSVLPTSKRGGCKGRTKETRSKISEANKKALESNESRDLRMKQTQKQHISKKLESFKNITFDSTDINKYIFTKKRKGIEYAYININGKKSSFVGKYESIDILIERAKEFITLIAANATLPNCSGTP